MTMYLVRLFRWKQLNMVVILLSYLISTDHLVRTQEHQQPNSDEPDDMMQLGGVPQFMPKFLQKGEWSKVFSQSQSSSLSSHEDGSGKGSKSGSNAKRAYGSMTSSFHTKTSSSRQSSHSYGGGIKNVKRPGSSASGDTSKIIFNGGCLGKPNDIHNAVLHCSVFSGCRASCMVGYKFPNGEKQLFITCQEGEWQVENAEWETIPHCEAICLPPCQHNGICVKPNECNCPENYAGPQCQFEKKPCLNYPPTPANSRRSCTSKSCTVSCAPGNEFPDGSSIANLVCREGTWIPSRSEWKFIPDCQSVCKPSCENGGNCLSFNVCQCPKDFRGPQCQYAASVCAADKLGFNGGYKCSGSQTSVTCSLSCPAGSTFSEHPASQYVCEYSVGKFTPAPPQCIFDSDVQVISDNTLMKSFHSGSMRSGSSVHSVNSLNEKNSSMWTQYMGGFIPETSNTLLKTGMLQLSQVSMIEQLPHPGFCYVWGRSHFKTFDGAVFSFESRCSHTLVADVVDNTFNINLEPKTTHTDIKIFAQDKEYILTLSDVGIPILRVGARHLQIPTQMSGIVVDNEAHFIVFKLTGVGLTIQWDSKDYVGILVTESLWNRTAGLCGPLDGRTENDFMSKDRTTVHRVSSFINSWKVKPLGAEECESSPEEVHACQRYKIHDDEEEHFQLESSATAFCNKLLMDPRFAACRTVIDVNPYFEACKWDYCSCSESNSERNQCACQSFTVFVKICNQHSKTTEVKSWRDNSTCPMQCSGNRIYFSCGPTLQETCKSVTSPTMNVEPENCEEGCYCPTGTVLHEQRCVSREQCPCQLRGKMFQPGAKVPKDCNTCICVEGQWSCTQVNCGGRCGAVGDPHYQSFDGKHFNFMGKCSYHLLKGDNYSIDAENVACAGSISEAMSFPPLSSSEYPSCTKTVTIHLNGHNIKLKQGREVIVDGQEVSKLPFTAAGAYIHIVSSIFLIVELPNGLEVWWDGLTRVYIDAPASFQGKTKGLCGTFNQNQNDDFLTPEGDIEQDVVAFANKWKTKEACQDIQEKETSTHPCDVNAHNKATAEKHCSKLKGALFEGCHWLVDPEPYYQDCMFDLCSCQVKVGQCLCPIFAAYAKECSHKGVQIDWRNNVRECGVHCPGGQIYQICGNTCTRSCYDISRNPECKRQCVEGCNCPEGQTIDSSSGECIPIGQCECQHNGIEYPAGFREVRAGNKGLELCVCRNALWDCRTATPEESKEFPKTGNMKTACSDVGHEEFTTCEPVEPITCKNMHNPPQFSPAICKPGCKCKKGYVLDSHTKKCILPEHCPCHHGGKSYGEGESIQEDCNTCKCESAKWSCSERVCAGICTAWGDSHYKTFDGRIYDFHGNCDYVLAKGSLGFEDIFDISIQNVPCGSSGISCSKSVTLRVGSAKKQESVTFTREKPIPSHTHLERITIREAGLFVYAEVFDLGLVLQWDKGTRVYVRIDPKWKDRLKGLCGNYNDNQLDDFQTPSGGLSEVSANLFGDSWRLQSYCSESIDVTDTCLSHPNRKLWAMKKCGVLKTSVFQSCHSEVPLEPYLERCIFDACGCDLGGDCECLCTAVSAYAQECNIHGVSIKWRSQQLCPIQCDEKCSHYSSCVQTCPKQTCDNYMIHSKLNQLCFEDACVEGCEVTPCPPGQVYNNLTSLECVPVNVCKPICMELNDVTYYEGDVMEEDSCHKCMCSHKKKSCLGYPCTTAAHTTETTTQIILETLPTKRPIQSDSSIKCASGWTKWHSNDALKPDESIDIEPLPVLHQLSELQSEAICNQTDMVDIKCRVVGTHQHYKETGDDVECSLERGLVCVGGCNDYEISVLCKCPVECDISIPYEQDINDCHVYHYCNDTPEGPKLMKKTCGPDMMYNPKKQECDYPINVIALRPECGGHCDVSHPNSPHPNDCHIFYHCKDTLQGIELVEKTCGPYMMYNPDHQVCDWPASVIEIRPECGAFTTTTSTISTEPSVVISSIHTTSLPECKPGWSSWYDSPSTATGDFELLDDMEAAGRLPCARHAISNIECKFFKNITSKTGSIKSVKGNRKPGVKLVDYTKSGEIVTCDPTVGLSCINDKQNDQLCEDYRIRLFCSCGETTTTPTATPTTTPTRTTTSTTITTTSLPVITSPCGEFEVWSKCAISCSQICIYYEFTLKEQNLCSSVEDCIPGCLPASNENVCPLGYLWRDDISCVRIADCTCRDHNGKPVKPGELVSESDCEICQCVDNQYECTNTCVSYERILETERQKNIPESETESSSSSFMTTEITLMVSTVTPPVPCDANRFNYILEELPFVKFSANNINADQEESLQDIASPNSGTTWKPNIVNKDQYLQVDLGSLEPVYGTVTWGNPKEDEYVTSYMVMYSDKGDIYTYVTDSENSPAIFRGPADHKKQVIQPFYKPIEARFIRWNPLTWHKSIAMKVNLIGCGDLTTEGSTISIQTTQALCMDQMGLENNMMADEQISVSSVFEDNYKRFGASHSRLNGLSSWMPGTNSRNQWIQFDFLEPRNITGIITQGYKESDSWIVTYNIRHSHDGKLWNPIIDSISGLEKEFLGNFDSVTPHTVLFDRILHTQYLRLFPVKWHQNIALRADVLGCFEPYPTFVPTSTSAPSTTAVPIECNPCPELQSQLSITSEECQCPEGKFWNGEICVIRAECPCYDGYHSYPIGKLFEKDCQQCVCKIGGIMSCKEKECPTCEQGLQKIITPSCGCVCKPCPPDMILCPTSNICINETSWCDGLEDCPDDEKDCTTTTTAPTTIFTTVIPVLTTVSEPVQCPIVECPPEFKVVSKKTAERMQAAESSSFKGRFKGTKSGKMRLKGTKTKLPSPRLNKYMLNENGCQEFTCVPEKKCTTPQCPPNYIMHYITVKNNVHLKCPEYSCIPPKPPHATCNITGRSFNTFDEMDFKYDVCNHILARDLKNANWEISVYKDCPQETSLCSNHIIIVIDEHEIYLNPDLSVDFNGYKYTLEQLQRIGTQLQKSFTLSNMGGTLLFHSLRYDFFIVWDRKENMKIAVSGLSSGYVDGLCGFFDQDLTNDRMKPDGSLARTTAEFGDSWVNPFLEAKCHPSLCPTRIHHEALKICSLVREAPFIQCNGMIDIEKYVSNCVESACLCLQGVNSTESSCKCQILLDFVTKCSAANANTDLSSWRVQFDCPASCSPPLIHHDCYRRECEPSCNSLKDGSLCPAMPGTCFSGCFCPDGLVRKGDKCVMPNECRDCMCNGFGDPQYITFDKSNYTFNGNCTYVASRDTNPHGKHTFQVLVTNVQCQDEPISTCTEAVLIEYSEHKIHIRRKENPRHELETYLDGKLIHKYPFANDWMQMVQNPGVEVTVLIPQIQLEVSYYFHNFAFTIHIPSHTFGHNTEGLCGNCNGDNEDDFKSRNGTLTADPNEFGQSWLHPLPTEADCTVVPKTGICKDPPPNEDPCLTILDSERFGMCHPLVDPYPYVAACRYDRCHSVDKVKSSCRDLEGYARECMQAGLCLNWRTNSSCPYECSKGLVYHSCGLGCSITCDNYKKLKEDPSSCSLSQIDGCFCPEDQVLIDGICKDVKYCFPCDEEGHVQGQIWRPDNCTTCTCSKDGKVACLRTECPGMETVCDPGMMAIIVPGTENDCCPKYTCISASTPMTCPDVQMPLCSEDQQVKKVAENDCPKLVCECKICEFMEDNILEVEPSKLNEIELRDEEANAQRLPGWELVINRTGCCPRKEWKCNQKSCLKPQSCQQYYNLIELPLKEDECCHQYKCEPPKDICLYEHQYISDIIGGERLRKQEEKFISPQKPGASWDDGPCRTCTCESNLPGEHHPVCKVDTCSDLLHEKDAPEYVLEKVPVPNQCCPSILRTACKEGNTVYEVGSEWASPSGDPCETYVCDSGTGTVQKGLKIQKCDIQCDVAFEYVPPSTDSCCGHCRQYACVVDGEVKKINSNWTSSDLCTTNFCLLNNGSYVVQSVIEKCPLPPPELDIEFVLNEEPVPYQCCKKIVPVACKVGDKIHKEGDSWPSPDGDVCKTMHCIRNQNGQILKEEKIQTCNTECAMGWEYVPPLPGSNHCCGKCEQVACVVDGELYKPGAEWSSFDKCTNHTCDNISYNVITMTVICPPIECDPEYITTDGCCQRCVEKMNQGLCVPEPVPLRNTIGLIKIVEKSHGKCTNLEAIKGFAECNGTCSSHTIFNSVSGLHDSKCECCQPTKLRHIEVELMCEDGAVNTIRVPVPNECLCSECSGSQPIKYVKGSVKGNQNKEGNKPMEVPFFMKQGLE